MFRHVLFLNHLQKHSFYLYFSNILLTLEGAMPPSPTFPRSGAMLPHIFWLALGFLPSYAPAVCTVTIRTIVSTSFFASLTYIAFCLFGPLTCICHTLNMVYSWPVPVYVAGRTACWRVRCVMSWWCMYVQTQGRREYGVCMCPAMVMVCVYGCVILTSSCIWSRENCMLTGTVCDELMTGRADGW